MLIKNELSRLVPASCFDPCPEKVSEWFLTPGKKKMFQLWELRQTVGPEKLAAFIVLSLTPQEVGLLSSSKVVIIAWEKCSFILSCRINRRSLICVNLPRAHRRHNLKLAVWKSSLSFEAGCAKTLPTLFGWLVGWDSTAKLATFSWHAEISLTLWSALALGIY